MGLSAHTHTERNVCVLLQRAKPHMEVSVCKLILDDVMDRPHRYFHRTRLPVEGWLVPCRECKVPTVHTVMIASTEHYMCPRCQATFESMKRGEYPIFATIISEKLSCVPIEPLALWLQPGYLPAHKFTTEENRRLWVESLYLRYTPMRRIMRAKAVTA